MAFFRRNKNNKLIRFLLLLIVVGVGVFFFFKDIKKASAEWFDSSWFYRQAITITVTSSASDVANLDTWFTMNTSALISSKMQSSCQDLRFTNANGKLLPYYIDSGCNTTATKIWVKIDLVPKNSTTYALYAYYGNPNAQAGSDSAKFNLYNGLVGYWNMNEASWTVDCVTGSVKDLSVNANNGASCPTSTGPAGAATGKYGNAGSFDGSNDYVDVGAGASLKPQNFTVGGWFKANANVDTYRDIITSSTADEGYNQGYHVRVAATAEGGNAGRLMVRSGNGPTYQQSTDFFSTMAVNDDTWHHFVFTNDKSTLKLYIDGAFNNSGAWVGNDVYYNATNIFIGKRYGQFWGSLDDLRIYNRALSATEVSQLYSDGTSSILTAVQGQAVPSVSFAAEEKGPSPVAYCKFDEGAGDTTYDDSTNNNDGTRGGGTEAYKPTWQTEDQCISEKCLKFDGTDDYVSVANHTSLQLTTAITVEGWGKLSALTGYYVLAMKGSAFGGTAMTFELDVAGAENSVRFLFNGSDSTNNVWAVPLSPVAVNEWFHYALTYDATNNPVIYINGVAKSGSWGAGGIKTMATNTSPLYVGKAYAASAVNFWNGFIDDVKIYPYVRTAAQILDDYNSRGSTSGVAAQIGNQSSWMSNGLVGYWKMDESSWNGTSGEAVDSSGAGNNGTAAGNATTAAGKFGNGGTFDGTGDYVNAGNGTSLQITGKITLSAWVYPTSNLTNCNGIVSKSASGSITYSLYGGSGCGGSTNSIKFAIGDNGVISTSTLSLNTWSHVVGTYDGSKMNIYINGTLDVSNSGSGSIPTASNSVSIGKLYSGANDLYFPGSLDEVRIYNRALSPKEVADLYSWSPGPVGWWKLDEKSGITANDSSGNDNSATLTNSPSWSIGKYGSAVSFAGSNQQLTRADDADFDFIDDAGMTVETWFKHTTASAQEIILSKFNEAGYKIIMESDGDITCGLDYDSTWTPTDSATSTAATYDNSSWHHIACVKSGASSLSLYLDGVLIASDTSITAANTLANSDPLYFGIDADGASNDFTGSLDDIKIYNYARSQKQILEDMNAGHPSVGSPVGSYAAYWKFDEGHDNTIYDSSVNANTGTNTGAAWTNNGKFGKALSFDGVSSYVDAGTPTSLAGTGDFTLSAWVKYTAGNDGVYRIIVSVGNLNVGPPGQSIQIYKPDISGNLTAAVYGSAGPQSTAKNDNLWHYVAGVFTGGNSQKLYVDGVLVGTPTSVSYNVVAGPLTIGRSNAPNYWSGSIDEVKIYPFALTADEIKTEYNRGSALQMGSLSDTSGLTGGSIASNSASAAYCIPGDTSTCNSPIGEWRMDDHTGSYAYDTSGNENKGTLTGANGLPTWQSSSMCHSGSCLKFDGVDDYVNMGDKTVFDPLNGAFTAEVWVNFLNLETVTNSRVISKQAANGSHWRIAAINGNILTSIAYSGTVRTVTGSTALANTWYHVVMVRPSQNVLQLYINGSYYDQYSGTIGSIDTAGNPLTVGGYLIGGSVGESVKALIDDVKIFNYARTPAQIAWDYNRGKPIGWWKFDECQGTTAYDSSGNSNTGTITIGTTAPQTVIGTCNTPVDGTGAWYNGKTGKFNSALSLDGIDDYVQVSDTANLRFDASTADFSLFAWIKRTTTGTEYILSKEDADNDGWRLMFNSSNQVLCSEDTTDVTSASTITDTNWHLIGCTIDRDGNGQVYIDSKTDGSAVSMGTDAMATTSNIRIGTRSYTSTSYFNGIVDDVKVYNYALTLQQIKMDYNQGAAVRFGPTTGRP